MRVRLTILYFITLVLFINIASAQSPNGTVSGIVLDPSAGVIIGADVLIINNETGVQYQGKANSEGYYVVPNIPPGTYRIQVSNSGFKTIIKPVPNREGHAEKALKTIETALKDDPSTFRHSTTSTDKVLDAAGYVANLLESAEMVPMYLPPSAQIRYWREQPPEKRERDAIRAFAYDLGLTLKKYCLLY